MGIETTIIPQTTKVDGVTIENTAGIINVKNLGIDTAQLKDLSVTNGKIANSTIETAKLNFKTPVLLQTITLSSDTEPVTFSGLDINTDGCYKIYFTTANASASLTRKVGVYLNGESAGTNYNHITTITTTSAVTREYTSGDYKITGDLTATTELIGEIIVFNTISQRPQIFSNISTEATTAIARVRKTNVTSNITSISLTFNGSSFKSGSIFSIYKIPK